MSGDSCPASPPRFLADVMLGTLAKWLRILGYDTAYNNTIGDDEIIERCQAEGRIGLTRDRRLVQRLSECSVLFIDREELFEQVRQVLKFVGADWQPTQTLSRCIECNRLLEEVNRQKVEGKVPSYVLETQTRFRRCPFCARLYWSGTHRQNIYEQLTARL